MRLRGKVRGRVTERHNYLVAGRLARLDDR